MSTEKTESDEKQGASPIVSASVPAEVAKAIADEAQTQDRKASYIIRRILVAHYAKRVPAVRRLVRKG